MRIERVWAMPNKWTFTIKPIKRLLERHVGDGIGWIDPFAGKHSPAETRNDLNPDLETESKMDALEFLKQYPDNSVKGVIYDPPYSYSKAVRLYKLKYPDTQVFFNYMNSCKVELCRIVRPNGFAIMCGWNSNGLGLSNGFELLEILLVPHGWRKIDTIVTVESKIQDTLEQLSPTPAEASSLAGVRFVKTGRN